MQAGKGKRHFKNEISFWIHFVSFNLNDAFQRKCKYFENLPTLPPFSLHYLQTNP